jgi:UDP-2-acetamido-3-amino-2,3-dideoxy-glucuronate N-acetyltransferase
MKSQNVFIHPTAEVDAKAKLGSGSRVWNLAQVREGAVIGESCNIGKGAYIDINVVIGNRCKIQNGVYVYHGATVEDGVLLGPGSMILNDKYPRAINADGSFKSDSDWTVGPSRIGYGATVGGGAIVTAGVNVGKWALIGAGTVVTRNVPDFGIVYGNPGRLYGFVCHCGAKLVEEKLGQDFVKFKCINCGRTNDIPLSVYESRQVQH